MKSVIEKKILEEARKVLRKFRRELARDKKLQNKFKKRTGVVPGVSAVRRPATWDLHKHFDPVYCIRHRRFLAKGIWSKIKSEKYVPLPALKIGIPKLGGGERILTLFSIPDSAVSKLFNEQLRNRNSSIFSSSSYAYQPTKNAVDAIINLKSFVHAEKVFVIQYDFTKYFDSIDHDYLLKIVYRKGQFLTTNLERKLISSFLKYRSARMADYNAGKFEFNNCGVPQGSSVSLFLANVALHELDKDLERRNGYFARFADDVVVVTFSYEDALRAAESFIAHCEKAGLSINRTKSDGVRILADGAEQELRSVKSFDFLGHKISRDHIGLSDKTIHRIKSKISTIIYRHLLLYPRRSMFNPARVGAGFYDWDLVTCLNEIRRYIYGGYSRLDLERFLDDTKAIGKLRGIMAFYALVDDDRQLHRLDGWLLSVLRRAHVERAKVLASLGYSLSPLGCATIKSGGWYTYPAVPQDTSCPSFHLASRAARKQFARHGAGVVALPGYSYS